MGFNIIYKYTTSTLGQEPKITDINENTSIVNKGMHLMICHSTHAPHMNHFSAPASGGRPNQTTGSIL